MARRERAPRTGETTSEVPEMIKRSVPGRSTWAHSKKRLGRLDPNRTVVGLTVGLCNSRTGSDARIRMERFRVRLRRWPV